MRWAWLLALILAGCGTKVQHAAAPASFQHARELLKREHFAAASEETAKALASAKEVEYWNLRLLRVELLLAQREAKQAKAALGFTLPPDPKLAEQAARYQLYQAYDAFLLDDSQAGVMAALRQLDRAEALARTAQSDELLAEIELRRGRFAIELGRADDAQQHLTRALEYGTAHGDRSLEMGATGNLGLLEQELGHYDQAISRFQETLTQAQALGATASIARCLGNIGWCHFRLGDLDKALQNLQQAEAHFRSEGIRYETQAWLGNIGSIQESRLDLTAAAATYKQALMLARQLGDQSWTELWLNNLAVLSIDQGDWDAAERYNKEAVSVEGDKADAYSLVITGKIAAARGDLEQADRAFQQALQQPGDDLTPVLYAHSGLAELYRRQGRYGAAQGEYQSAIRVVSRQQAALLDSQSKIRWFDSLIHFYGDYVDFLMERGRVAEALQVVEAGRGRVLAERIEENKTTPPPSLLTLQNAAARTHTTLISYWIGSHRSYGWAIAANSLQEFDLPGENEIRLLVDQYNASLQELRDPLAEGSPAGQKLYDLLIAPTRMSTEKVIVAPAGPLCSLNFATLPVSGAKPHYWLEDKQIAVVPSFALLRPAQRPERPSLLLIGDPVSATPDFPELAFAAPEMNGIEKSLPAVEHVVYRRAEARPQAYAAANPGRFAWIHFVAHAMANQDEPLQSAVILSKDATSEYRLFARNVLSVPLHADLVTISACHSAGARTFAGEGLVGFSWAFLKSGARNVIAGLWDVNDRSTPQMMATLYGELGRGARPAEALRTAQLAMVHSTGVFRKPYYWGPFEVFQAGVE